ncbi:cell division protein FtsH3-like protein [Carex littledalei]|uniref:Cell division protein FtsH3-like protein n=1 Tax=Carex littledalei TaxID=544730 RepID=A0A833QF18_9POAL|nr:cell division protein FtsH3-like protein [Carex littledalei]
MRKGKNSCSGSSKVSEQSHLKTFADVAAVDETKECLEETVEFLRNPERYVRLGARPPRSVLLVSMPGTGKTLLAKAVAGEADVFFISCSASEFVELYVGMGSSRVRGPKGRLLLSFSLMRLKAAFLLVGLIFLLTR